LATISFLSHPDIDVNLAQLPIEMIVPGGANLSLAEEDDEVPALRASVLRGRVRAILPWRVQAGEFFSNLLAAGALACPPWHFLTFH
jgi:hypothetical protein